MMALESKPKIDAHASAKNELGDFTWLSSKEAKKALKVSDCQLMHLRLAGKLQFRKEGNRFFYLTPTQIEKQ